MFTSAAPQKGLEGILQSEEKVNYTQEVTERVLDQLIKRGENLHCHHTKIMENNKQFSLATLSINSLSSPTKDID